MRRSKSGGHLISTRRPQSGQTHSSAPDFAQPLRIISCVSRTDVTHLGILGGSGARCPSERLLVTNSERYLAARPQSTCRAATCRRAYASRLEPTRQSQRRVAWPSGFHDLA
jgi:hypothetical protein